MVGAETRLPIAVQHLHGRPRVRHHHAVAVEHDRALKINGELEQSRRLCRGAHEGGDVMERRALSLSRSTLA